ncbi:MAG: BrnT family toxin [Pseudomonadales bacterium]|nr:BrnT family toxin [Pseudomonadales bacterium]
MLKKPCAAAPLGIRDARLPRRLEQKWLAHSQAYAEPRFMTLAPIRRRLCVVAWCYRNSALRVISMRKANAREIKRYEQT